ncbi:hypothetical protein A2368_01745 [Candidatus Collierbacteria bacterium RIFOXYB1_FULL_49_13]|uniref:Uncharacterized protein n=1 Tax=Candidatus Collierbacteria bacterium RIFOXYB1_FULL_49_13 TaxID=1817728 RepID=A0A1F5FIB4_9BACT|nr:MAG: hypothetical protein A2368_01745 [Candidatus Collierbacteria bacterium RIFOXYB1_FULL_49_13]
MLLEILFNLVWGILAVILLLDILGFKPFVRFMKHRSHHLYLAIVGGVSILYYYSREDNRTLRLVLFNLAVILFIYLYIRESSKSQE